MNEANPSLVVGARVRVRGEQPVGVVGKISGGMVHVDYTHGDRVSMGVYPPTQLEVVPEPPVQRKAATTADIVPAAAVAPKIRNPQSAIRN